MYKFTNWLNDTYTQLSSISKYGVNINVTKEKIFRDENGGKIHIILMLTWNGVDSVTGNIILNIHSTNINLMNTIHEIRDEWNSRSNHYIDWDINII